MNCLPKAVVISRLRVWDLEEKMMDYLGGVLARLPFRDMIMLHRREGLHLCEHD